MPPVKKLGVLVVGAGLILSLPVIAGTPIKKKKTYDCQSDKKVTSIRSKLTVPEYTAFVKSIDDVYVEFTAQRNFLVNNKIATQLLTKEKAYIEDTNNYLTVQGILWALAIAPEKRRASLYSSNPDINEVPMFCLSP